MFLNVEFWAGPSRPQPRRYHKVADWQPHKAYILAKRAQGIALEDIVTSLRTEKQLEVEVHQLKHVLRTWKSAVRISSTQRRYIVNRTLQRRSAGKRKTVFKYANTGEKIPQEKVEKILKRYKNEQPDSDDDTALDIIAQTPSAASISIDAVENGQEVAHPLQKAAARWLNEDSTLTPIEETLMAMSLIGDTGISEIWQSMDTSVPDIPAEALERVNPSAAQVDNGISGRSTGIVSNEQYTAREDEEDATEPNLAPDNLLEESMQSHMEQGAASSTLVELPASELSAPAEFSNAAKMLRPVCMAWMDRVKTNALSFVSGKEPILEQTVDEIQRLGYTCTETSEPLPYSVCQTILCFIGDKEPLPERGDDMLKMDWEPVAKIYKIAIRLLWGLFAGTSAFGAIKLYVDDVARVFYLPTIVSKYGKEHYFTLRALQSFGMCLALVCHLDVSADILEMAVKGFDNIGMRLHQHALDCSYQLAQVSPFGARGQDAVRIAQDFLRRAQAKHGIRHGRTISGMALVARSLIYQNQKTFALNILAQVSRITRNLNEGEKKSKQYADALRDLGKAEFYAGMGGKATLTLMDALQRNDDLEHRAPDSSHLSFLIGMIYTQSQEWENAIKFLRRSTMYRTDTFGEFHRSSASSMEALSTAWEKRGMVLYETPFLELLERLYKHYERRFGGEHQRTYNAWYRYGAATLINKTRQEAQARTESGSESGRAFEIC